MGKRVLITGGSGFVGANLSRRALEDGHEVHLILRPGHRPWRIEGIAGEVETHVANLTNPEEMRELVERARPDWVFHLAAFGAYPAQTDLREMVDTNLLGCAALVEACAAGGVEAFVNAGTSSEYGEKDHAPMEDELLEPNSAYAITKSAATHYVRFAAQAKNLNAVTVRLWSIYGPYEEPTRLIPTMLIHALAGRWPPLVAPDTARDFVFVDDAVDALLRVAATANLPKGSVYNLCSGEQSTVRRVVEEVQRLAGVDLPPVWNTMPARAWDTKTWVGSPERMAKDVGFRVSTRLQSGLEQTLRWFREEPRRAAWYSERILSAGRAAG
jgi:dolichol-phosphate mannosyltransferase